MGQGGWSVSLTLGWEGVWGENGRIEGGVGRRYVMNARDSYKVRGGV